MSIVCTRNICVTRHREKPAYPLLFLVSKTFSILLGIQCKLFVHPFAEGCKNRVLGSRVQKLTGPVRLRNVSEMLKKRPRNEISEIIRSYVSIVENSRERFRPVYVYMCWL